MEPASPFLGEELKVKRHLACWDECGVCQWNAAKYTLLELLRSTRGMQDVWYTTTTQHASETAPAPASPHRRLPPLTGRNARTWDCSNAAAVDCQHLDLRQASNDLCGARACPCCWLCSRLCSHARPAVCADADRRTQLRAVGVRGKEMDHGSDAEHEHSLV